MMAPDDEGAIAQLDGAPAITDQEFALFQRWVRQAIGIHLSDAKKVLLSGRLAKRLRARGVRSYREYYELVTSGRDARETETCVNLITTNETYFFREPKHFDYLRESILPKLRGAETIRVWSAASSSGEEAYTLAMVLAETLGMGARWEIVGTDISTAVLGKAVTGQYPMERASGIPEALLRRYCLKGVGPQEGTLLVAPELRARTRFGQVNLTAALPDLGMFDVVFLRNVLIYFQPDVKTAVVERLVDRIRPGGWLFIGHSETLNGITQCVTAVAPTIYRKDG